MPHRDYNELQLPYLCARISAELGSPRFNEVRDLGRLSSIVFAERLQT
jgi:hypothetical protein